MNMLRAKSVFLILLCLSLGLLLVPERLISRWRLAFFSEIQTLTSFFRNQIPILPPTIERTRASKDLELQLEDARRRARELEIKNIQLQSEVFQLRKSRADIAELREFFPHLQFFPAQIIGRASLDIGSDIILACGSNHGVRQGDAVLQGQNVAGQVVEVMPEVSRAHLVTSPRIVVPARLSQSRAECYVRGTEDGACEVVFLGQRPSTVDGEIIFTSGLNAFFPPDIIIGELAGPPVASRDQRTYVAPCTPRANLHELEEILVVRRHDTAMIPPSWRQTSAHPFGGQ